jgi:hypothetical protein
MFEYKVRKTMSLTFLGYLIFLTILAFIDKPINYDFSICLNSTNSTNSTNNTYNTIYENYENYDDDDDINYNNVTNNTTDTDLCPCKNILTDINIFNIIEIITGIFTCIFLVIAINKKERTNFLLCSIIISTIYLLSGILIGSVIFIKMVIQKCITPIHNEGFSYFLGFILHYIIIIVITGVISAEHKNLSSLLNCSKFINRKNQNYNVNNDEDSNNSNVSTDSPLLKKEQPPPYYN